MSSEDYLRLLRSALIDDGGQLADDAAAGTITIERYSGRNLEYPTTIRTTPEAFHAYLDSMGDGVRRMWPDASRRRAGYNIFLVHLDEEMTVVQGNPDTITITARAMKTDRSRPYVRPSYPEGDYEWHTGERGSATR